MNMFRSEVRWGLAVVVLALVRFARRTASAGVVTLVSQERFVDVNTTGISGLPQQDQRQSAPDFGPFNGSVSINLATAAETATQSSTLTVSPDGNSASFIASGLIGEHSVSLSGLPASELFKVSFEVSAPAPYLLNYVGFVEIGNGRFGMESLPGSFTGPSAPGDFGTHPPFDTHLTGILQPGQYTLSVSGPGDGTNFNLDLEVGAAAVPLPAACWAALAALPVAMLARRKLCR
jgi:hypothetical protein